MDCTSCGYCWADLDDECKPISLPYCHYEGPDEWAPCAQDDYYEEPEEDYYDDTEEYEAWLAAETQRELEEEFREEYGRLMTITRYNLPKCNKCSYWGWCNTIPQECSKGAVNGNN